MAKRLKIRAWLLALLLATSVGCEAGERRTRNGEVPVQVARVTLDREDSPVVILEEDDGDRWLPIWIGSSEARSIAVQMAEVQSPRPNTHDLARNLIEGLEASVLRVVVTDLRANTYYAELTLLVHGEVVTLDSRPSDAIAIALRTHAPIFVDESLFAERDPPNEGGDEGEDGGVPI